MCRCGFSPSHFAQLRNSMRAGSALSTITGLLVIIDLGGYTTLPLFSQALLLSFPDRITLFPAIITFYDAAHTHLMGLLRQFC